MKLKHLLFYLLAAMILLPSVLSAAPALLWEVKHPKYPQYTAYLAGSVHLRKETHVPLDKAFDDALDKASVIIYEIASPSSLRSLQFVQKHGTYAGQKTDLAGCLGKERYDKVSAFLGIPIISLNQMRPWLVWNMMQLIPVQKAGFMEIYGFESLFRAEAKRRDLPAASLENEELQLNILAQADEEEIIASIDLVLANPDIGVKASEKTVKAVEDGDVKALAALIAEDRKEMPKLSKKLLDERNAAMAKNIFSLLQKQNIFVLVGAGHFVGETSILNHLKKAGCTLRQLEKTGTPGNIVAKRMIEPKKTKKGGVK